MADSSDSGKKDSDRLSDDDMMALFAEDDSDELEVVLASDSPAQERDGKDDKEPVAGSDVDEIDELSSFLDNFADELAAESDSPGEHDASNLEEPFAADQPTSEIHADVTVSERGASSEEDGFSLDDLNFDDDESTDQATDIPTLDDTELAGEPAVSDETDFDIDLDVIADEPELDEELQSELESGQPSLDAVGSTDDAPSESVQSELFDEDKGSGADQASGDADNDDLVDGLATTAAMAGDKAASSLRVAKREASEAEKPMNKFAVLGVVALSIVALVVGGIAFMMVSGLQSQVKQLNTRVESLGQNVGKSGAGGGAVAGGADPRMQQIVNDMRQVNKRLEELALIIEGPVSHLRELNEHQVNGLNSRLDDLEAALQKVAKVKVVTAPQATSKAVPVISKPAAKPAADKSAASQPAATGDWLVAVVSLSDRQTADYEARRMQDKGVDVEVREALIGNKSWYRLVVPGFTSRGAATAYTKELARRFNIMDAWAAHE